MARSKKIILLILVAIILVFACFFYFLRKKSPSIQKQEFGPINFSLILPHIDTAQNDRKMFLNSVKISNPSDIIILSTNHFSSSTDDIIFDSNNWTNKDGLIKGSQASREFFSNYSNSHELILNDHGIRNPIADIYQNFPKAEYSNFLIKDGASDQKLDDLTGKINQFCSQNSKNCLIVGSVDFSHYNISQIADLHDQYTIQALQDLDLTKIKNSETDSSEILRILITWSKIKQYNNFSVFSQNNSGKLAGNFENETTSWVLGKFEDNQNRQSPQSTLMFAGDIMLDRMVNHKYSKIGFEKIFEKFGRRVFKGTDASVANFEGPVNDGPVEDDISVNNLIFNFPLASLDALSYIHLNGLSLANNHTLNDSAAGLDRTREILKEKKFFTFGSPDKIDEFSLERVNSKIPVSLIGANTLATFSEEKLKSLIEAEKSNDRFVVVFPHWGAEYQTTHNNSQKNLAHQLIDWGVDLVIGSHPHVIQDCEIYNGKFIAYSLGNFVFDQSFSKETMQGLILSLLVTKDKVKIGFVPVSLENIQVQIIKGEQKDKILEHVLPNSPFITKSKDGTIELQR